MSFEKWPPLTLPATTLTNSSFATKPQISPPTAEYQLREIFEGYSENALATMLEKRGQSLAWTFDLTTRRKARSDVRKRQMTITLAECFYHSTSLHLVCQKLSLAARFGLAILKHSDGLMSRLFWLMQLGQYFDEQLVTLAEEELVGGALVLYAGTDSRKPNMSELRLRHVYVTYQSEVGRPTFGLDAWLYLPPLVAAQLEADKLTLPELAPPKLTLFEGTVTQVAYPASHSLNALLTDLFSFIRAIEREKLHITKSGEISKRDKNRLITLVAATTTDKTGLITLDEANNSRQLEAEKRRQEARFSFLWELLKISNLVRQQIEAGTSYIVTNPTQVEEFFALPDYQQARLLTRAWLASADNEFWRIPTLRFEEVSSFEATNIPNVQKLSQARQLVLNQLQTLLKTENDLLAGGGWLDLTSFKRLTLTTYPELLISRHNLGWYSVRSGVPVYLGFSSVFKPDIPLRLDLDWHLVEGEWLAHLWREALAWLGLGELGLDAEGQAVAFRLTELGRLVLKGQPPLENTTTATHKAATAASLIVQPNFEVLVLNPRQNLGLLKRLDEFATPVSLGDVALYRITKASVLAGLRQGLSGEVIIAWLNEYSSVPLAQNLIASLSDWAGGFERLTLRPSATILEVASPTLLDALLADPAICQKLEVEKRLGETYLLLTSPPPPPVLEKILAGLSGGMTPQAVSNKGKLKLPVNTTTRQNATNGSNSSGAVYLNYAQVQSGTLSFEDGRRISVKKYAGTPYLYYKLGQFADLVSWDVTSRSATFALTLEAGKRAQEIGLDYATISPFLAEWKKPRAELPIEFELRLKNWLGEFTNPSRELKVPVRVSKTRQLDLILQLPAVAKLGVERVSGTLVLVPLDELERFTQILAEFGFALE